MATATLYNAFKKKIVDGSNINLASDTIKAALVQAAYTPNIDTDDFWNNASANEASGTGYSAGGATLANVALTIDTTNDLAKFDADDVVWTISSALVARYILLYKSTGNSATSPLIGYIDLGANYALSAGTLAIVWNASGILTIS